MIAWPCRYGKATKQTAEAGGDVVGRLQGCCQARPVGTVKAADADEAIEKAAREFKVVASKLIAVPRR